MPQGLQIFDEYANETFNMNDSVGRVLGVVNTGTDNGSVSAPFDLGVGWFMLLGDSPYGTPDITISGNTLSWNFSAAQGYGDPGPTARTIIYGIR